MNKAHWWQKGVIYQIYPRSFMDSNADGIGDLQGVTQRLDYLSWLGIDAIWFSPLFPSPMADFGYDVADYQDVHPDYGTLQDFDQLLVEAHSREIKIILDLVPNHSSDEHEWFIESRSSQDNPKRDWYIWRDPAPDGGPPNNWLSYFGGPAWTFDAHTGQYYMHNFHSKQPELNWRNPAVKEAIFDSIRFWLRRGVDGFRIDVIDRILKDPEFRDNPLNPNWKEGDILRASVERIYSEQQFPEIYDYIARFRDVFDEFPETVSIGEIAYGLPNDTIVRYYGEEKLDAPGDGTGLHLPFNFNMVGTPWKADAMQQLVNEYDAALPSHAWPNYVLGNHDVPRIASKFGQAQARIAAMLLLTLRGTPTLYYGDEIGMENVPIPLDRIQDPQGLDGGFNRDECRAPMSWDSTEHAGFSDTEGQLWLPVSPDYMERNVAIQRNDPQSMLSFYHRLLTYRRQTPALNIGRYYPVEGATEGVYLYLRQYNDQRCLVVLNFTDEPKTLDLSEYESGNLILSTHPDRDGLPVDLNTFELLADEGVIIEV